MGKRNLLPLCVAAFDTGDSVGDALLVACDPVVITELVRVLGFVSAASSASDSDTVKRLGSEKSGNASSSPSAMVTTDRRTDELGIADSDVMLRFVTKRSRNMRR